LDLDGDCTFGCCESVGLAMTDLLLILLLSCGHLAHSGVKANCISNILKRCSATFPVLGIKQHLILHQYSYKCAADEIMRLKKLK